MSKYYIYRFLDKNNKIVYVGKTVSLKKRLKSHFNINGGNLSEEQYSKVEKIEYLITKNRIDMDIKELYYINKWKPKFNKSNKYNNNSTDIKIDETNDIWISYDIDVKSKVQNDYNIVKNYGSESHLIKEYKHRKGYRYGIINNDGKIIIDCVYKHISKSGIYYEAIKENGKHGVIDEENRIIIDFKYDFLESVNFDEYIIFNLNNKYGVMDYDENIIIDAKYDNISVAKNNCSDIIFYVEVNFKYGLININGDELTEIIFNEIWEFDKNLFKGKINKNESVEFYMINKFGNLMLI